MAYDAFLKLDGVTGESQKDQHKGEIELLSFSWGVTNPTNVGTGTGMSTGKASVSDFSITKPTDSASGALFKNCCSGKHFNTAVVALQKATGTASGEVYLKYEFDKVMITNISWSGSANSGAGDHPVEHVSFAFENVKVTYKPQDSSGKLGSQQVVSYNVASNKVG